MRATLLPTGRRLDADDLRRAGVRTLRADPIVPTPLLDWVALEGRYVRRDTVSLGPATPDLDAMLAHFAEEHRHGEDEVRYILDGAGVFDVRAPDDAWIRVEVVPGDLVVIPARRWHRFFLGISRAIYCVRMFRDPAGWVAEPRGAIADDAHASP